MNNYTTTERAARHAIRAQLIAMGFHPKTIRRNGLDNPRMSEDARAILLNAAVQRVVNNRTQGGRKVMGKLPKSLVAIGMRSCVAAREM